MKVKTPLVFVLLLGTVASCTPLAGTLSLLHSPGKLPDILEYRLVFDMALDTDMRYEQIRSDNSNL